jgi:hypothetical protein
MSERKGPGRRPKDQKRIPLSVRITPEMRDRLVSTAKGDGRSITQEVELLLEQALSDKRRIPDILELAYGPWIAGLLIGLGYAMKEAGRVAHMQKALGHVSIAASGPAALLEELENWPADPHAFNQAVKAAITLFEAVRPEGEFEPAVEHHSIRATNLPGEPLVLEDFDIPPLAWGHSVASGVLQAVAEPETVGPILKELASSIRERLGSESVALIERRVAPATGERK